MPLAVILDIAVSTHSRLKAAGKRQVRPKQPKNVSTHSRLKAAGKGFISCPPATWRFNTQPPEGGWQVGRFH